MKTNYNFYVLFTNLTFLGVLKCQIQTKINVDEMRKCTHSLSMHCAQINELLFLRILAPVYILNENVYMCFMFSHLHQFLVHISIRTRNCCSVKHSTTSANKINLFIEPYYANSFAVVHFNLLAVLAISEAETLSAVEFVWKNTTVNIEIHITESKIVLRSIHCASTLYSRSNSTDKKMFARQDP